MSDSLENALAEMIKAGEEPKPKILERVKSFGAAAIPRLIEIATSEELNWADSDDPRVYAPLHAIKILGEMRAIEAVEPILPMLAWIEDDWLAHVLPEFFGCIGEPAIAPLEKILADDTQTMYVHARVSTALAKIAQAFPETRDRVVKTLTQYLEPQHTQKPDHETRAGFIIGDLSELQATEALPAIRRVYEEDRVDTQVIGLDDVEREMQGLPLELPDENLDALLEKRQNEELDLALRCTNCGRERRHKVRLLYVDLGIIDRHQRGEKTRYDEFVIPQRITCPKCGAVDQYEFTSWSMLTVTADLVAQKAMKKPRNPNEGRIRYIRFALSDGRQMHPREALEMYREQVKAKPKDAELRVRYGNVLSMMGYLDEAVAEYRAALVLDPTEIEACVNLGTIYGIQGEFQPAREMLRRALALEEGRNISAEDRAFNTGIIRARLAPVEQNEKLNWSLLSDRPSVDMEAESGLSPMPRATSTRIGRNDPCHCGSGKKFKHCHGK